VEVWDAEPSHQGRGAFDLSWLDAKADGFAGRDRLGQADGD
jgi:hypothetical protein